MGERMTRRGLFWSILAGLLLICGATQAQMTIVGSYTNGGESLDVFTYRGHSGSKAAGLGFQRKISVNLAKADWGKIVALWQKARGSQGASFRPVGSFTETDTKDPSTLTLAAGTGVRFTIDQPAYPGSTNKPGTYSVTVQPQDFARLDAYLAKVTAFLNSN
jgi:hypothetical protein